MWLTEALSEVMILEPGMRVLDMGCGTAKSSIFLAREFDVEVWATDLWVKADENWQRIRDAGLEGRVFSIHAEAHALPFASEFFDASISMDAYHYFGTDDLYIRPYSRLVKPGGQLGIIVPGLVEELSGPVPEHLAPYWVWDFCSFHSPAWWRRHWEKSEQVEVELADMTADGWKHWLHWNEVCLRQADREDSDENRMLRADAGQHLGLTRVVARRK